MKSSVRGGGEKDHGNLPRIRVRGETGGGAVPERETRELKGREKARRENLAKGSRSLERSFIPMIPSVMYVRPASTSHGSGNSIGVAPTSCRWSAHGDAPADRATLLFPQAGLHRIPPNFFCTDVNEAKSDEKLSETN